MLKKYSEFLEYLLEFSALQMPLPCHGDVPIWENTDARSRSVLTTNKQTHKNQNPVFAELP